MDIPAQANISTTLPHPEFPLSIQPDFRSSYIPVAPLQPHHGDQEPTGVWSEFVGPGVGPHGKRGWSWEEQGNPETDNESKTASGRPNAHMRVPGPGLLSEFKEAGGEEAEMLVTEVDFRRLVGVQRAIARLLERAMGHVEEIPSAEKVVMSHSMAARNLVEECVKVSSKWCSAMP